MPQVFLPVAPSLELPTHLLLPFILGQDPAKLYRLALTSR